MDRNTLDNLVNEYIKNQSKEDKDILFWFVSRELRDVYRISSVTGCSAPKVNYVVRKLKCYLNKQEPDLFYRLVDNKVDKESNKDEREH